MQYNLFWSVVGWYGVAAIVTAYFLVNFELVTVHDASYQFLNITGALGLALETWIKRDYQPMVLNIIWLIVALVAVVRVFFN